jgi:hypothetical protein
MPSHTCVFVSSSTQSQLIMRFHTSFAATIAFTARQCQTAPTGSSETQPEGFPGSETPYRITPPDGVDASNVLGTYLWGYDRCNEEFDAGAKGKIDEAYYDAWVMTK